MMNLTMYFVENEYLHRPEDCLIKSVCTITTGKGNSKCPLFSIGLFWKTAVVTDEKFG